MKVGQLNKLIVARQNPSSSARTDSMHFPRLRFCPRFQQYPTVLFSGSVRLRLIFGRDRHLLLDLQDFRRCMFPEKTLHIGRKFAQKIPNRVRAQGTTKTIHGIPESPVMSWVVGILRSEE